MKEKIIIVGSGMAGCFMALCLAKKGFKVEIYEERSDIRKAQNKSGRSFNITLYYRGILALKKVNLWNDIKEISVLTRGNVAHYHGDRNVYDPYDAHDTEVLYTVHRNKLNSKLLDIVEKLPNVKLIFNTKCISIDKQNKEIYFQKTASQKIIKVKADRIVGADGVNSTVRSEMQKNVASQYLYENEDWGYKEVNITPELANSLNLKFNATHTWPRRNSLLIAFPNPDNTFTLMINLPLFGRDSFETLDSKDKIKNFITANFPDLKPILSIIIKSILNNPTGRFATVKTSPWSYKDFIVLIGDSAHSVIPFYGQGVCAALDDCLTIMNLLKINKYNWEKALRQYEQLRKKDTDTLSILAKENFIELRDKSRSQFYILKDKADTLLSRLFPNIWMPSLYILIAHGTLNYDKAYRLHKRQQLISKIIGLDLVLFISSILWGIYLKIKSLPKFLKSK
jgi:kynurenine 3-monooxygenase